MLPFFNVRRYTEVGVIENQITFTPENWNVDQEITIYGVDDILYDGDITTNLFLSVDTFTSDIDYKKIEDIIIQLTNLENDIDAGWRWTSPFL